MWLYSIYQQNSCFKKYAQRSRCRGKKIRLASGVGKCSFSFSPLPDLQGTRQAVASPLVLTSGWPHTPWALELKHASSSLHRSYQTKDSLCFLLQSVCVGSTSHPPGSRQKRSHTVFLILPSVWVAGNQDWYTQTLLCAHGDCPSLHIYTWFPINVHYLCNIHSCCFIEMFLQCVAPT